MKGRLHGLKKGCLWHLASACLLSLSAAAAPEPLQIFTVKDYLEHTWTNELVHFPISYRAWRVPKSLTLTDSASQPVPSQVTGLGRSGLTVTGTIWTVVSVPPGGEVTLQLRRTSNTEHRTLRLRSGQATNTEGRAKSDLHLVAQATEYVLRNEFMAARLPKLSGVLPQPVELSALPAPLLAVAGPDGTNWLGQGAWTNEAAALQVKEATTTVIEEGPVRVTVRYRLTFADGRFYRADVSLGHRQEVTTICEESDLESAKAGWRLSFQPGLNADQVFWNNQWSQDPARRWALMDTAVTFDKTNVVATLRPWSFWWAEGGTMWAGFYNRAAGRQGSNPFVGVLMLNPSQWLPAGAGFAHTAIPINAGPSGRLDITLSFLTPEGKKTGELLRREWGVTVGTTAEHVLDPKIAMPLVGKPGGTPKLRYQLIRHGEFPLDEVKDYGFNFTSTNARRPRPFLILSPADVARVRRQAKTVPAVKAQTEQSLAYIASCGGADRTLTNEGAAVFYQRHYWGNGLTEMLPEAYLGSDDPIYGKMMAAAVQGLSKDIYVNFIEHPTRPALGAYGPWVTADFTRLLFAYDLIAGSGLLSPEDDERAYRALVFGAQFLAHPDFWNVKHGLASGNPNMTSMVHLSLGLLGLYLDGHPQAASWSAGAETELKEELADWITPDGGAWLECPGYQGASLDGMLLLATAIRSVHGRDYFADPSFRATMDYLGTLLTPPDRRFPPPGLPAKYNPTQTIPGAPHPALLPPVGDTPLGTVTPFAGWMAAGAAASDPVFSREQAFFWKLQNHQLTGGNRGNGYTVALCDPELPAAPPTVLARRFPGFGNVFRTSWTDPRASYVAHRTGPHSHHYHDDYNSFIYYAKGAPLCLDFGNQYAPLRRDEAWWHNRVSFSTADSATKWGSAGETIDLRSLSPIVYSYGRTKGSGNQEAHRHLVLIQSDDPLGANYMVVRDRTVDGQPGQVFSWNLFCLARAPQIVGNTTHFPGQFDVDLDVHMLAPAAPVIFADQWKWEHDVGPWKTIGEELHGVRIAKTGSSEDYLAVLYPRATGQGPAEVATVASNAVVEVTHMEGKDFLLLSPDRATSVTNGDVRLAGEIAFVRIGTSGVVRLAVVMGTNAIAAMGPWELRSSGPAALEAGKTGVVTGESSGEAHDVQVNLPPDCGAADVALDGKPVQGVREGNHLTMSLPGGSHIFTIKRK